MEDVHWADEATMDLLRFAGRRLRGAAVLLIVTYRDDDLAADDPLRVALGELARQRSTRRISLTSLSADAVRVLARGSDLEAAALYRLTGGNPFYVTEVLPAGMAEVPASARDAVLARAAGLSADGPAAARGRRPDRRPGRSRGCSKRPTGCPPSAVDELLACGLLAADSGGLRFRHEIARLAVEQAIPARRRAAIHGQHPHRPALVRAGRTTPSWPFTPRGPTTARPCCGTRPRRRGGRPGWRRTGRRSRSSGGRCGSRPGPTPPRSRACTTTWPPS